MKGRKTLRPQETEMEGVEDFWVLGRKEEVKAAHNASISALHVEKKPEGVGLQTCQSSLIYFIPQGSVVLKCLSL